MKTCHLFDKPAIRRSFFALGEHAEKSADEYVEKRCIPLPLASQINRDLKIRRHKGNEKVKKQTNKQASKQTTTTTTIGLVGKPQLCTCSTFFFCTFLCHFRTTTMWNCLILSFIEDVNKRRRNIISLS